MSGSRLVLPVANPETASRLLETAVDVASDRDLELLVVHVVAVPEQTNLEQARASMDASSGESVVSDAVERARAAGVEATGLLRYGHDIPGSLASLADADDVEVMLLGWHGRPRRRDVILGSYIDAVLREAACDVLVERIDRDRGPIASVLVPVAGGPHTELAAEVAGAVSRAHDGRIELLTVIASGADDAAVTDARTLLDRTAPSLGAVESVTQSVRRDDDAVRAIREATAEHDVTVLGAGGSGLLHRIVATDVAETVARNADSDVLLCRRHERRSRTLWRRFVGRVDPVRRVGDRLVRQRDTP